MSSSRWPTSPSCGNVPGDFAADRRIAANAAVNACVRRSIFSAQEQPTNVKTVPRCQGKWSDQTLEHHSQAWDAGRWSDLGSALMGCPDRCRANPRIAAARPRAVRRRPAARAQTSESTRAGPNVRFRQVQTLLRES